jgi:ABC-2 type transport system ATP-binding protein
MNNMGNGEWGMGNDKQAQAAPPGVASPVPSAIPHSPFPIPHSEGVPLLLCQRVSKWYGPVIGVNQVTLELRPGITGLVGANGAGKSTLMRLITGQLRPDLGRVQVLGHDAWTAAAKRHVGFCPETDSFYEEMSGRRFVEAMALLCGYPAAEARERAEQALRRVRMVGRAERALGGYSKGMRQRVKLAQALLHDPALLVLDEPLSGIDPVGRAEFIELFRDLAGWGKCLLVSSHELDELEKLTDHVAIMARGRIAAVGPVAQIRDRLDDNPLRVHLAVRDRNGEQRAEDRLKAELQPEDRLKAELQSGAASRQRDLAGVLLRLPDVVGVELLPPEDGEASYAVLVRARNPQRFFADLARLVLDEWLEVCHLRALDDSTEAVLGYLLGGGRAAQGHTGAAGASRPGGAAGAGQVLKVPH